MTHLKNLIWFFWWSYLLSVPLRQLQLEIGRQDVDGWVPNSISSSWMLRCAASPASCPRCSFGVWPPLLSGYKIKVGRPTSWVPHSVEPSTGVGMAWSHLPPLSPSPAPPPSSSVWGPECSSPQVCEKGLLLQVNSEHSLGTTSCWGAGRSGN